MLLAAVWKVESRFISCAKNSNTPKHHSSLFFTMLVYVFSRIKIFPSVKEGAEEKLLFHVIYPFLIIICRVMNDALQVCSPSFAHQQHLVLVRLTDWFCCFMPTNHVGHIIMNWYWDMTATTKTNVQGNGKVAATCITVYMENIHNDLHTQTRLIFHDGQVTVFYHREKDTNVQWATKHNRHMDESDRTSYLYTHGKFQILTAQH